VAQFLHIPLDLIIARKIGHPDNPEYAVCAVTEEGELLCNENEKSLLDPLWFQKK
jgi:predicted phosphoribosyltransferase